ncbi:MAG: SRPBCC family protein [Pseudomonadota bacterium]
MIRFLIVAVSVFLLLLLVGVLLPGKVVVERSVEVNRPAATVFTVLNGFQSWVAWSPWAELDPTAELTLSGPDHGVGAHIEWSGDPSVLGTGRQQIRRSEPYRVIALDSELGGHGPSRLRYTVEDGGIGSRVTWRFEAYVRRGEGGLSAIVGRYFGLFMRRWVASDFERGLARFKGFVERLPEADFAGAPIERRVIAPMPVMMVDGLAGAEAGEVASALAVAFAELSTWALAHGAALEASPMTIATAGEQGGQFAAALVLHGEDAMASQDYAVTGRIRAGQSPGGEAVCLQHSGPAESTLVSYERLYAWIAAHGLRESGLSWEHYLSEDSADPSVSAETDICLFLAADR